MLLHFSNDSLCFIALEPDNNRSTEDGTLNSSVPFNANAQEKRKKDKINEISWTFFTYNLIISSP
jgi:hypothetical protein